MNVLFSTTSFANDENAIFRQINNSVRKKVTLTEFLQKCYTALQCNVEYGKNVPPILFFFFFFVKSTYFETYLVNPCFHEIFVQITIVSKFPQFHCSHFLCKHFVKSISQTILQVVGHYMEIAEIYSHHLFANFTNFIFYSFTFQVMKAI